jgi:hypothetical protein
MGREVRRVPASWEHPQDEHGNYIPMHEHAPEYSVGVLEEGIRDGWLREEFPHTSVSIMPNWWDEDRTHYQMYEDVTEGTPISPVMESPEALARWLADNNASAFADMTASYEQWLKMITGPGVVCSGILNASSGEMKSGVAALSDGVSA